MSLFTVSLFRRESVRRPDVSPVLSSEWRTDTKLAAWIAVLKCGTGANAQSANLPCPVGEFVLPVGEFERAIPLGCFVN